MSNSVQAQENKDQQGQVLGKQTHQSKRDGVSIKGIPNSVNVLRCKFEENTVDGTDNERRHGQKSPLDVLYMCISPMCPQTSFNMDLHRSYHEGLFRHAMFLRIHMDQLQGAESNNGSIDNVSSLAQIYASVDKVWAALDGAAGD